MFKKNGKQNKIQDALNDCIESIFINNETGESCLERHSQYAQELNPLVDAIKTARSACSFSPDPSFRARARFEFHRAMNGETEKPAHTTSFWRLRWATAISSFGVLLLTFSGSAVAASSGSMPNQPLYQIKRGIESVQINLATSKAGEARLYAALADRRVGEIVYAAQLGDAALTQVLTEEFAGNLNMVSSILFPSREMSIGKNPLKEGTASPYGTVDVQSPPMTAAGEGLPLSPVPAQDSLAAAAAPSYSAGPELAIPQATITISGIDDPVLLKLLQQYSIKNNAELLAVLDSVPLSAREALLRAIDTASAGYDQLLSQ